MQRSCWLADLEIGIETVPEERKVSLQQKASLNVNRLGLVNGFLQVTETVIHSLLLPVTGATEIESWIPSFVILSPIQSLVWIWIGFSR